MEFQIGLNSAWWYSAAFGLVNLIFIFTSSKAKLKRLMRFPRFKSKVAKIISYLSVILFTRGLIILTIFIPVEFHVISFIIGTSIFITCLVVYVIALNDFLSSDINEPVTKGVYNKLRHPMQLMAFVMWIGIGIASLSWLIIVMCIIQLFVSYPFLIAQEQECLDAYSKRYMDYFVRTKRYF
jgi:protein-S-isoprenylcysteine O-methyltransferase Ste14